MKAESPTPPAAPSWIEKALTTTTERAQTLFQSGYTIDPDPQRAGVYVVTTPERTRKGEAYANCYEVDLANATCDCPMFQFSQEKLGVGFGTCKHLIATRAAVEEAVRLAVPMIPRLEPPPPQQPLKAGRGYAARATACDEAAGRGAPVSVRPIAPVAIQSAVSAPEPPQRAYGFESDAAFAAARSRDFD